LVVGKSFRRSCNAKACIVNQDINFPEMLNSTFDRRVDLFFVGHVQPDLVDLTRELLDEARLIVVYCVLLQQLCHHFSVLLL
jgi:flavorubredoxin